MFVCILTISQTESPDLFKQVIATCDYCVEHDRTQTFKYEVQPNGEGIKIYCPLGKDQCMKRGKYFFLKHQVHFESVWEKHEAT